MLPQGVRRVRVVLAKQVERRDPELVGGVAGRRSLKVQAVRNLKVAGLRWHKVHDRGVVVSQIVMEELVQEENHWYVEGHIAMAWVA